jgi:hypothetical protein
MSVDKEEKDDNIRYTEVCNIGGWCVYQIIPSKNNNNGLPITFIPDTSTTVHQEKLHMRSNSQRKNMKKSEKKGFRNISEIRDDSF